MSRQGVSVLLACFEYSEKVVCVKTETETSHFTQRTTVRQNQLTRQDRRVCRAVRCDDEGANITAPQIDGGILAERAVCFMSLPRCCFLLNLGEQRRAAVQRAAWKCAGATATQQVLRLLCISKTLDSELFPLNKLEENLRKIACFFFFTLKRSSDVGSHPLWVAGSLFFSPPVSCFCRPHTLSVLPINFHRIDDHFISLFLGILSRATFVSSSWDQLSSSVKVFMMQ